MQKNFSNKSIKELQTMISEKRNALRNFRFSVSGSNARNVKEGKNTRKDIARILTILNEKQKIK